MAGSPPPKYDEAIALKVTDFEKIFQESVAKDMQEKIEKIKSLRNQATQQKDGAEADQSSTFLKVFQNDLSKFEKLANGMKGNASGAGSMNQSGKGQDQGDGDDGDDEDDSDNGQEKNDPRSNDSSEEQLIRELIDAVFSESVTIRDVKEGRASQRFLDKAIERTNKAGAAVLEALKNGGQSTPEGQARKGAEDILNETKEQVQQSVDSLKEAVKKAVEQAAEDSRKAAIDAKPAVNSITLPDLTNIEVEGVSADNFELALKILNALQILWLCGPAGCGKTVMAEQLSKALNLPYYAISCTAGISESWFIGRRDINGDYIEPEFLKLYENGGVILLDEFDAADPNTGLIVNAAIGNGYLTVPLRVNAPLAKRHPKFYVVFATNTWGFGVDGQYTGREGMDASTRDRAAMAKVVLDYSWDIEVQFLPDAPRIAKTKVWKPRQLNAGLGQSLMEVRKNIKAHNLKRIVSTRAFHQASLLRAAGFSDEEIISIYFTDWSENERAKGTINVA